MFFVRVFLLVFALLTFLSCDIKVKEEPTDIVAAWSGKRLILPESSFIGSKAQLNNISKSSYKIITYVDSVGCFDCRLQLRKWKEYYENLKKEHRDVSLLFYFNLSNKEFVDSHFQNENFDCPYFLDRLDSLNKLNNLPKENRFRTFLVGKDNRVLAIGNPITNPSIQKIYSLYFGDKGVPVTNAIALINKAGINFGIIPLNSVKNDRISILNKGPETLEIKKIGVSCDCIKATISKKKIKKGETAYLKVRYYAKKEVEFYENIYIESSSKQNIQPIEIKGIVKG